LKRDPQVLLPQRLNDRLQSVDLLGADPHGIRLDARFHLHSQLLDGLDHLFGFFRGEALLKQRLLFGPAGRQLLRLFPVERLQRDAPLDQLALQQIHDVPELERMVGRQFQSRGFFLKKDVRAGSLEIEPCLDLFLGHLQRVFQFLQVYLGNNLKAVIFRHAKIKRSTAMTSKATSPTMRFGAAVSEQKNPFAAAEEAVAQVTHQLHGSSPDLAFLFVSILYRADWKELVAQVRKSLKNDVLLLGCTAGGVVGQDQELEGMPALSLTAAHLPRVKAHPFTVTPEDLSEERDPGYWVEKIGASPSQEPVGILLPEPFSCDCMALVQTLNTVYPGMPLIGGLASGARNAGENALFFNDGIVSEGAVGVLLTGDILLQTVVSQGCRPIGRPFIVTKAEENLILELAGSPATEALRQLYAELPDADKTLAQRALLLGVVMNEYQEQFRRGDFLIRNLIGIDPSSGAIAVGDRIRVGQTVQFQVRDAQTSKDDLQTLLKERIEHPVKEHPPGGLLFNCLGRGRDLYGEPHHDIRAIQKAVGPCPIAGFFCNGEIGPVGSQNYIHGFTSSLGLFRPKN